MLILKDLLDFNLWIDYNIDMNVLPDISEQEIRTAKAIADLLANVPTNDYGFPIGIYRPDLLPFHDYLPESSAVDVLLRSNQADRSLLSNNVSPSNSWSEPEIAGEELQRVHDEDIDDQEIILREKGVAISGSEVQPKDIVPTTFEPRIAGFRKSDLKAAFVPLDFSEGYPTLPDGRPVWDRIDCESKEEFVCFQAYLEMPQVCEGSRVLGQLPALLESNELLHINGYAHSQFTHKFSIMQKTHYWSLRSRAYDLFKTAAYRKQQDIRALQTQDSHYSASTGMLKRLIEYMEDEDLFWDQMTPKVAVDTLKTLIGIQRVSVGLPATAPANVKSDSPQGQTLEMILRSLTQGGSHDTEKIIDTGRDGALASRILSNPDDLRVAQELIVRLTLGQQQQP